MKNPERTGNSGSYKRYFVTDYFKLHIFQFHFIFFMHLIKILIGFYNEISQ